MNAISHVMNTIEYTIPKEILNAVFSNCKGYEIESIEEKIRLMIILGRVMPDINLVHGETAYLPISDGTVIDTSDVHTSVFYSDEYLQGREIISAMLYHSNGSINSTGGTFNSAGSGTGDMPAGGAPVNGYCNSQFGRGRSQHLNSALNSLGQQSAPIIPNMNTQLIVIAKNTILMRYNNTYSDMGAFEVQLSNDPELNNISPKSVPKFTQLCLLALKSYIYNKKFIELGHQDLFAGQHYSQLNEYINNLSNAEEDYQTYLNTTWSEVSYINDTHQYAELIKISINPFN